MKKIILIAICVLCLFAAGCSSSTLDVVVSGNSAAVMYCEDGVLQLITIEEDVAALADALSTEYEKVGFFEEKKATYIFYFGDDLDLNLDADNPYVKYAIINEKAYVVDDGKSYRSVDSVDLSILDKYHREKD